MAGYHNDDVDSGGDNEDVDINDDGGGDNEDVDINDDGGGGDKDDVDCGEDE